MEKNLILLETGREVKWLSLRQANKVGLIIATLLISLGISTLFKAAPPKTLEVTVPKTSFKPEPSGLISGETEFETIKIPADTNGSKFDRFGQALEIGPLLGAGICLFLRSFLPELTFLRVVLTVLGGYILGFPVGLIIFGIIIYQGFPNIGALLGDLFIMGVGLIILKYGFRPKVFKWLG